MASEDIFHNACTGRSVSRSQFGFKKKKKKKEQFASENLLKNSWR
jgi:hypothetical protein